MVNNPIPLLLMLLAPPTSPAALVAADPHVNDVAGLNTGVKSMVMPGLTITVPAVRMAVLGLEKVRWRWICDNDDSSRVKEVVSIMANCCGRGRAKM